MILTEDLRQLCCSTGTSSLSFKNKQEGKDRKNKQLLRLVAVEVELPKLCTHGPTLNPRGIWRILPVGFQNGLALSILFSICSVVLVASGSTTIMQGSFFLVK
jgi:hypothetical protein